MVVADGWSDRAANVQSSASSSASAARSNADVGSAAIAILMLSRAAARSPAASARSARRYRPRARGFIARAGSIAAGRRRARRRGWWLGRPGRGEGHAAVAPLPQVAAPSGVRSAAYAFETRAYIRVRRSSSRSDSARAEQIGVAGPRDRVVRALDRARRRRSAPARATRSASGHRRAARPDRASAGPRRSTTPSGGLAGRGAEDRERGLAGDAGVGVAGPHHQDAVGVDPERDLDADLAAPTRR
jgi:hypothetical protein